MLDIFKNDAFSLKSLTEAINKLPYKPSRLGQLGLFTEQGVTTTSVMIEERAGLLALLPTRLRGEPATTGKSRKRTVRSLAIPHIPQEDTVRPEDVQGVRAFGTDNQLEAVSGVVNDKLTIMRQNHEVTLEYHRIGAIQGKVLDADGATEIVDLFDFFGVSETEVDFVLTDSDTDVRLKCLAVKRAIESALGALPYTGVHCFCGSDFFDALISHQYVKTAYDRWQNSEMLRNDPRAAFPFAGINFEEYRGSVSGVDFIDAEVARFVPLGVPRLFMNYFAPGDFMETANTIGLPLYAKQEPMEFNRGIKLHTQQNPLNICTRPGVLIKGNLSDGTTS